MKMKKGEDEPDPDFIVYITVDMIDEARRDLRQIEKKFKNRGAVLKARKADCLARIIKASRRKEGQPPLEPYQVALAQVRFKKVLSQVKRLITLERKRTDLIEKISKEEEELEKEAARMRDVDDLCRVNPNSNQMPTPSAFYLSPKVGTAEWLSLYSRNDYQE